MRFPQAENYLLMADYFCFSMMLLPLPMSSMSYNRLRWPPQAYMFYVRLLTRACLLYICFV